MPQDIRLFVRNGKIVYIHHNTNNPNDDEPGESLESAPAEQVRFKSKEGNIKITFANSPFVSTHTTLTANRNTPTNPETLRPLTAAEGPRASFKYKAELQGIADDPEIIIDEGGGGGGGGGGLAPKKYKKPAKKKATRKKK